MIDDRNEQLTDEEISAVSGGGRDSGDKGTGGGVGST